MSDWQDTAKAVTDDWRKTSEAAQILGCCPATLRRKRDINGGFLEAGVHWLPGLSANSYTKWNVTLIREAFFKKGMEAAIASTKKQQQNPDEA